MKHHTVNLMSGESLIFETDHSKQVPLSTPSIKNSVLSKPTGEIVIIGKEAQEHVHRICTQFVDLMMSYDRVSVFAALQFVLGTMWCNDNEMITKQESIDRWRMYSAGVEATIRQSFGEMKYGDDQ